MVAMGLWVVARMLLCDCYGVVGGCQAFYMFLSDLIQEYWWLPDCFYLIDMKNVGGCQEVAVWLLWGCGWLSWCLHEVVVGLWVTGYVFLYNC